MAYTRVWTNVRASNATTASTIDDKINELSEDISQRMADVLGNSNWSSAIDPVIDGTVLKSIKDLTAGNVTTLAALISVTAPLITATTTLYARSKRLSGGGYSNGSTGSAVLDLNLSSHIIDWNNAIVVSFTNQSLIQAFDTFKWTILLHVNNTSGSTTLTWPANVKWTAAGPPTNDAVTSDYLIEFTYDGTYHYGSWQKWTV